MGDRAKGNGLALQVRDIRLAYVFSRNRVPMPKVLRVQFAYAWKKMEYNPSKIIFFKKGSPRPLHQSDAYGHLINEIKGSNKVPKSPTEK